MSDGQARGRKLAIVLLAAGRSTRFGGDKLAAELAGKPVIQHCAEALSHIAAADRIVVCCDRTPAVTGFRPVPLSPKDAPLSRSIAVGIGAALGADAALIALADMPLVPLGHFEALVESFAGARIGTSVGGRTMVPAIFPASDFASLLALDGDRGAGAMLRGAKAVSLPADLALDIDSAHDLDLARLRLQGR